MDIESLPRICLATLPTPLEDAPRLSQELGVRVLFKRDDLTGFALGGNKVRKLEFLVADSLDKKADVLVTGGGPQSNHARLTAAAARKVGLDAKLVFFGDPPAEVNGNLLLDDILGAEIQYTHTLDRSQTEPTLLRLAEDLRGHGRMPYVIPRGGSTPLGCIAYVLAVQELLEQLNARQIVPSRIFVAAGSCGTQAGILMGLKYFGSTIPLYGITVSRPKSQAVEQIARLVHETGELLQTPLHLESNEINVDDVYLGEGYGMITPAAREAIHWVARLEGIFLDPVYTGKTMAGLIDLARRRMITPGETIVFWHTGGAPGIFGHAVDFSDSLT
jgi:D-cysteine desulfhydrase family pyridoxal phosphate-dependent enzyme